MKNFKKTTLTGFLGQDPKIIKSDKGDFTAISLASSNTFKNKEGDKITKTDWFDATAHNSTGSFIAKYLKKGSHVLIEATPYSKEIVDSESGKKYKTIGLNIDQIYQLDKPTE